MGTAAAQRQTEPEEFVPPDYFRILSKEEIFPDGSRPLEVDLGCGDGTFLVDLAAENPGRDFLGVERLMGRVRKVCRKARRRGLANVKVLRLESAYTVGWLLPEGGVARAHLLCPDPWPKKKHHRRRLVDGGFVKGLHRVLEPGGEFLFKSDHAEYFEESVAQVRETGLLEEVEWSADAFFYPETDFERQWKAEGKTVRRARFVSC